MFLHVQSSIILTIIRITLSPQKKKSSNNLNNEIRFFACQITELLSGTEMYEPMTLSEIVPSSVPVVVDPLNEVHTESGHSRNNSNTSQLSKGSGYGSLNSHSQHSRQSSSGDSGHIRYDPFVPSISSSSLSLFLLFIYMNVCNRNVTTYRTIYLPITLSWRCNYSSSSLLWLILIFHFLLHFFLPWYFTERKKKKTFHS